MDFPSSVYEFWICASHVFDFLLTGVRVLRDLDLFLLARGHETADRRAGFKDFGSCDISFRQHLMRVLRIFDVCMIQIAIPRAGFKDF